MNFIEIPLAKYGILIPLINALSSFPLFNEGRCSLYSCELPFFAQYQMLEARTFSTIPPVTMHYLWNPQNNDIIKMDGDKNTIFKNLDRLSLQLNAQTVIPYLRFVLNEHQSQDGTLRLVECADEIEFSQTPTAEVSNFLRINIKPAVVTHINHDYNVSCYIIYGDSLFRTDIRLQPSGVFEFIHESQIGEGMSCLRQLFLE